MSHRTRRPGGTPPPAPAAAEPSGPAAGPGAQPGAASRTGAYAERPPSAPAAPRAARTASRPAGRGALRPRLRARLLTGGAAGAAAVVLLTAGGGPAAADSIRDRQWALTALHAQKAWQTTKGAGVTVAVLDTGVDATHPDLTGQVLTGTDLIGFGAARGDKTWANHGTGMAALIAGHGHGPGRTEGVLGLAPEAKILPVRVILEDKDPQRDKARSSRGSALPEGIRWAVDHGADVINLSLGDDSATAAPVAAEADAIQYALGKGVVVVASAGNSGDKTDRSSYPAAYPGVIAVAAVDSSGRHPAFSTHRWYASVSAPGEDIVMADPDRKYYDGLGTSAASAYASGAVALLRSAYPELSPLQIKQVLQSTTRHKPDGGRSDELGTGEIDPAAALAAAAKLKPAPLAPVPADYPQRYFGSAHGADPAPRPAQGSSVLGNGVAAAFAAIGAALVATAGILWSRPRRTPPPAAPPHAPTSQP
ncbi:type VII secretion-associated serine protease mycosin [Actinacidiphila epipremni]|uniref:Type VII secretion-associated serine protease mycosin n=1 Tax=Actinacidiphila epipremni TaxID=2053013 RepID=A0ABX0ZVZ6_9ACTN|nr:type VII secretion-associated serine protease mycosin [Actinacidiphila epipremni]NJP45899.1 type VII secretion-associated serine protease mycosin [Actinacidiphila epipremni]